MDSGTLFDLNSKLCWPMGKGTACSTVWVSNIQWIKEVRSDLDPGMNNWFTFLSAIIAYNKLLASASGLVSASIHVIIDEIKSFTGRGFFYSTCQIHFERGQLSLGVERTEKIYDQSIRGVFMLQISTLLLRESCRLSVKNLKFCAKLSWIEDKSARFDAK